MKFLVDQTLGRLAKWLRLLGFDVSPVRISPRSVISLPQPEKNTYIITCQRTLAARLGRGDVLALASADPEAQLQELCRRLQIAPETWKPLQRCTTCNQTLVPLPAWQAQDKVPDFIALKHHHFFECPQCGRVFWEGSHQRRIRQRLQELQDHMETP